MFLVYFYLIACACFTLMWICGELAFWKALVYPMVATIMLGIVSMLPLIFLGGLLVLIAK